MMNRPLPLLAVGFLALAVACSSPTDLEPTESCIGASPDARPDFEDPALAAAIRDALQLGPDSELTCGSLSVLTELDASESGITSLLGIQNLVNLRFLDLTANDLEDLSALSEMRILHTLLAPNAGLANLAGLGSLQSLTFLELSDNSISDLSPLASLRDLDFLDLSGNLIDDVTPLSGMTSLLFLYLEGNRISSIAPLSGLTTLRALQLGANCLAEFDCLSNISPLAPLTELTTLHLDANSITDVTALGALPQLALVDLSANITLGDIQPLLDNDGLAEGDAVNLRDTAVDCPTVNALRAKGVIVDSGCPPV